MSRKATGAAIQAALSATTDDWRLYKVVYSTYTLASNSRMVIGRYLVLPRWKSPPAPRTRSIGHRGDNALFWEELHGQLSRLSDGVQKYNNLTMLYEVLETGTIGEYVLGQLWERK